MARAAYTHQVRLLPGARPSEVAAAVRADIERSGSATITVRTEDELPKAVIQAAVDASSISSDVTLYVLGYYGELNPEALLPFRAVHHINLNVGAATNVEFLGEFTAMRSLVLQTSSARKVSLEFLAGTPNLTRLAIPSSVTATNALSACDRLRHLQCSSNPAVLSALSGHPSLRYLDISVGSCRDLSAVATIATLRGLALYRIVGLDGDDLRPIGRCAALRALSLGAAKHVTHLDALKDHKNLRALLVEAVPNLTNLEGLAGCDNLEQLGLYESRPKDRSLAPLRNLSRLAHLVLGDPYPEAEIRNLQSWYSGSFCHRGNGPADFKPRWRTPIDVLDPEDDLS